VSAQPSPRSAPRRSRPARTERFTYAEDFDRAIRLERRRRVMHFRRRRRDVLEDCAGALVLMIFAIIVTPGLGMLAILAVPVALVLVGTVVAERRLRRRRLEARRGPRDTARG
jgi:Flp pilus assembly protein TadB